jgi:hypothetical protein
MEALATRPEITTSSAEVVSRGMPTDVERDERETDRMLATLAHLKAKRDRKKFADLLAVADRLIAEEAAIVKATTEAADKTKH